jgi:hypothetical protein
MSLRMTGTRSGAELPESDAAVSLVISGSPEIVVETLNVVLTEIVTQLDLDENQGLCAGVSHSVQPPNGNVDDVANRYIAWLTIEDYLTRTCDHVPVLGTMSVTLIAETLLRLHDDFLHLIAVATANHHIAAPGTLIAFLTCHAATPSLTTRPR